MILWQCGHFSRALIGVSGRSVMSSARLSHTGHTAEYSNSFSIIVKGAALKPLTPLTGFLRACLESINHDLFGPFPA